MGYYLNNPLLLSLYESETKKPYFVDKTRMLQEFFKESSDNSEAV